MIPADAVRRSRAGRSPLVLDRGGLDSRAHSSTWIRPRYVAWIKLHGEGRVFYCSPSHFPESYESATMLRFILDGIQYATGDLECDDSTPRR